MPTQLIQKIKQSKVLKIILILLFIGAVFSLSHLSLEMGRIMGSLLRRVGEVGTLC